MAEPLPDELVTERMTLRTWRREDHATLADLVGRNVEHLRPWMPFVSEEPLDDGARLANIDRWELLRLAGSEVIFGIWLDGVPVGSTGLHRRGGPEGIEIGYWIDQRHQGRGLVTEAAAALTTAAFARAEIDWVEIHHDRGNTRSGAVPARLGYRRIGEHRRPPEAPGECGIDVVWRIGREEWPPRP